MTNTFRQSGQKFPKLFLQRSTPNKNLKVFLKESLKDTSNEIEFVEGISEGMPEIRENAMQQFQEEFLQIFLEKCQKLNPEVIFEGFSEKKENIEEILENVLISAGIARKICKKITEKATTNFF